MKSMAGTTEDTLTDCLTIHPLQQSLSPLAKTDSNVNCSPGASHDSHSSMSQPWRFTFKCFIWTCTRWIYLFDFGCGGQPWRVCHPCSSAAPQGQDPSNPHLALMCSLEDSYRYSCLWVLCYIWWFCIPNCTKKRYESMKRSTKWCRDR